MEKPPKEIKKLAEDVEKNKGEVLAIYQEPFSNKWQLFVKLPIEKVKPTPYQRDLSEAHVSKLKNVIETMERYLDPIILVRTKEGYWTPNGNHRREAMIQCQKKWITGILIPETEVAFQILALNTEKVHNLKEKSLEVVRMYKSLMEENKTEKDYAFYFEEACLITLGLTYERLKKFAGGAYYPLLKRIDNFLDLPLRKSYEEREKRSKILEEVNRIVNNIVEEIKKRGIHHPFIKNYVVAKCNPIGKKRKIEESFDKVMEMFRENLSTFDSSSINEAEILKAGF